jgi:hypothetical protein
MMARTARTSTKAPTLTDHEKLLMVMRASVPADTRRIIDGLVFALWCARGRDMPRGTFRAALARYAAGDCTVNQLDEFTIGDVGDAVLKAVR